MKGRLMVFSAAVFFGVLLASLAVGEGVVRWRERSRTTVPGTTPTLYYRHVRLGHSVVHDFSYFGWISIDSAGFRRTHDGPRASNARPVVLVLGGSATFDTQVSGDLKAWPARLESWLRANAGFQGAILNGGVSGYRVVDNLVRLETTLADFQPDMVLLYHAHNDLFSVLSGAANRRPADVHRPGRAPAVAPWVAWLEERSLLYGKVVGRIKALRFLGGGTSRQASGAVNWDSIVNAGVTGFERDLRSFAAVAKVRGIPLIVMTVTHLTMGDTIPGSEPVAQIWAHTLPGVPAAVVLRAYEVFNRRIESVAEEEGIPVIRGADAGVVGLDLYADGDPIHFNDSGADRFAHFVASRLGDLLQQPVSPEWQAAANRSSGAGEAARQ